MAKKKKVKPKEEEKPPEEKPKEEKPKEFKRPGLKIGAIDPSAAREWKELHLKAYTKFNALRAAVRDLALKHGYILAFPEDREQWYPYGRGEDVLVETTLIKRDSDKLFRLTVYADGSVYVEPL